MQSSALLLYSLPLYSSPRGSFPPWFKGGPWGVALRSLLLSSTFRLCRFCRFRRAARGETLHSGSFSACGPDLSGEDRTGSGPSRQNSEVAMNEGSLLPQVTPQGRQFPVTFSVGASTPMKVEQVTPQGEQFPVTATRLPRPPSYWPRSVLHFLRATLPSLACREIVLCKRLTLEKCDTGPVAGKRGRSRRNRKQDTLQWGQQPGRRIRQGPKLSPTLVDVAKLASKIAHGDERVEHGLDSRLGIFSFGDIQEQVLDRQSVVLEESCQSQLKSIVAMFMEVDHDRLLASITQFVS